MDRFCLRWDCNAPCSSTSWSPPTCASARSHGGCRSVAIRLGSETPCSFSVLLNTISSPCSANWCDESPLRELNKCQEKHREKVDDVHRCRCYKFYQYSGVYKTGKKLEPTAESTPRGVKGKDEGAVQMHRIAGPSYSAMSMPDRNLSDNPLGSLFRTKPKTITVPGDRIQ